MRVRHWSARALRSTSTSVEVAEVAITRAGDHGLARSWWRDEHTEVMVAQIVHGVLLLAGQRGGERELPRLAGSRSSVTSSSWVTVSAPTRFTGGFENPASKTATSPLCSIANPHSTPTGTGEHAGERAVRPRHAHRRMPYPAQASYFRAGESPHVDVSHARSVTACCRAFLARVKSASVLVSTSVYGRPSRRV